MCRTIWPEEVNRPCHMGRDICHLPISRKALSIHPLNSVQLIETLYKFDDNQKNSYGVISKRLLRERILWSYIDHSRIVIFTCHFNYSQSLHLYLWNFCSSSLILHNYIVSHHRLNNNLNYEVHASHQSLIQLNYPHMFNPGPLQSVLSVDGPDLLQGSPKWFIIFKRCNIIKINNY